MASIVAYTGLAPQIVQIVSDAATDAFTDGDLVKTASGELVLATATLKYIGIARTAAVTGNDQVIDVELLNPAEIYVVKANTNTAKTNIGESIEITIFTAGAQIFTVSGSAGSADGYVVGLHPDDAEGLDGGRYLIRFEPGVLMGV